MAKNKPQFDVLLGGTQHLPPDFSIGRFASARAQEIAALTQAIEDPQRTGLVFQKLPKHMRRRVMSRTCKRLPRRLREAHMHQLRKSGLPPKPKRPSRKFRRRPQNLLLEYNRRQKSSVWLETHVWHAKRFHMTEKWGYKLADSPNDKSFRACYRATANHCLLQDISYYSCIELSGPIDQLLEQLQKLTSKECGLTFGAKVCLDGTREGSVMLFHQNMFPCGAIGRVRFLWKQTENVKSDVLQLSETRTMWIWAHPAFYQELLDELISLFHFTTVNNTKGTELNDMFPTQMPAKNSSSSEAGSSQESTSSPAKKKRKLTKVKEKKKKDDVEKIKLATRNVPFIRTPKYQNDDGSVEMVLLKDTLNRFQLTGPLSQAVLLESLHIANILESEPGKIKTEEDDSLNIGTICLQSSDEPNASADDFKVAESKDWYREFFGISPHYKESCHYQETLWQTLKGAASPAQLPPHFVLALTIQDPRLKVPLKRTKAVPDEKAMWGQESKEQITSLSSLACVSPIWSSHIRDLATSSKMSSADLAEIRSHNLIPGFVSEEFDFGVGEGSSSNFSSDVSQVRSCIPVLLIQRPGSQDPEQKRLGFASGWDVVMPAGWALPLWLALVFRGARVGGLRESGSLSFEAGSESLFAPDTVAGSTEARARRFQLTECYFRLPPDKRPNYVKLGITSPFICSWNVLINDWSQGMPENVATICKVENSTSPSTQFFVLRERKKLEVLRSVINNLKTKQVKNSPHNAPKFPDLAHLFPSYTGCCLVPIIIYMCGKGSPADHAIICLPSETDVGYISKNSCYPGPTEEPHADEHQMERKELRTEHKKLLTRLRRKRVRERRKCEDLAATKEVSESEHKFPVIIKRKPNESPPTKDLTDKHAETMRSLWLPQTEMVRNSSSRTVIGFVTKGDFSFTESQGVGQGYVVLSALLQLIACCERRLSEGNKLSTPWVLVRNPTNLQYRFGVIHI